MDVGKAVDGAVYGLLFCSTMFLWRICLLLISKVEETIIFLSSQHILKKLIMT